MAISIASHRCKSAFVSLLLQVAILSSTVHALFTQTTHWNTVYIQKNSHGTFCYLPDALTGPRETTCKGIGADFVSVLEVHLNQGLSIAYYNGVDNTFLGGADYSLPVGPTMPIIRLCVSGRAGDGIYLGTLCLNAIGDNVLGNYPFCQVAVAQKSVTDGCYQPLNMTRTASYTRVPSGSGTYISGGYPTNATSGGTSRFGDCIFKIVAILLACIGVLFRLLCQ